MKVLRAGGYGPQPPARSHRVSSPLMATRSTQDPAAPGFVGRYELVAPIASGALGELWQARVASGPEAGRVVDIRRIPRSERLDASHVERLTNAGFAAMELRHPRIAAVLRGVVAGGGNGVVRGTMGRGG